MEVEAQHISPNFFLGKKLFYKGYHTDNIIYGYAASQKMAKL